MAMGVKGCWSHWRVGLLISVFALAQLGFMQPIVITAAYAWKLVPTDKTPAGKREDISLREKVNELQKDLDDGIDTIGKK